MLPAAYLTQVASSNFGSGSACPAVKPAGHLGRVSIFTLSGPPRAPPAAANYTISLAHGFPHEICVAGDPTSGGIFAAAVDASDLPPGTGIGAITKYTLQA